MIEERDAVARKRRRRLLLALAPLVALAVWFIVGFASQPLSHNAAGIRNIPFHDDEESGLRELFYEDQTGGEVMVSLTNNGPFSVTVTDVQLFSREGELAAPLIVQDDVRFEFEPREGAIEPRGGAFREQRAGMSDKDTMRVYVTVRFVGCDEYEPGTGNVFDHMTVRYRYLGLPRTATSPLLQPLSVTSPDVCD